MKHDPILQDTNFALVSPLQKSLTDIRLRLGFRSAKAFYDQYLTTRTRLDFNYSYYMKIEGGKITPSSQIVSNLCLAFENEDAKEIMLSYCEVLFPERANVFSRIKSTQTKTTQPKATSFAAPSGTSTRQTYLTLSQIACLSHSRFYYFAFLILTLARRPLGVIELKASLSKWKGFEPEEIETLIEEFVKAKLIQIHQDQISSIANDMKFPVADSISLKKLYEKMDAWNIAFHQEMNFVPAVQKMMLRRVSPRYLSVIEAHCNVLIDLIRASDEMDPEYNDEVLMLNVSIQKGTLPG